MNPNFIHPSAVVESGAEIGANSKIWHFCHVRAGAVVGADSSIGKDCYIDSQVKVGFGSRIQNGVSVFNGVNIEPYVFVGPHVVFTNDMYPRAGTKTWDIIPTHLLSGCSLGAGAIIRCGVTIGSFAMIGAGAIVTKDVQPFTLAFGFPAQPIKRICACGRKQFDLNDAGWTPVHSCCRDNLTGPILGLAEKFAK